jgi:hypothetical protein
MAQIHGIETPSVEKGTRANARLITRKLASAEKKLREAMAEIAEAEQAIINGENEANIKLPEFTDLRGAIRIARRATSTLQLSWEEYDQARIGS